MNVHDWIPAGSRALLALALAATFSTAAAQDAAKIRKGFAIAPVPLDLAGKNS